MANQQNEPSRGTQDAGRVDLSIVILNYNTRDLLEGCLAALREQSGDVRYDVHVVDNASRDGSTEMVRDKFPEAILTVNAENLGFARGNNEALLASKGRYAMLLNSDTRLPAGVPVLQSIVGYLDQHPEIGALGPKILREDGTIQLHCARSFPTFWTTFFQLASLSDRFPRNRITGKYLMSYWDHESPREVDVLLGACMVVRREVIESVGVMDEQFFLGGEDVDWCRRIKEAGWKVFYYPEAWIVHRGGASKVQLAVHESRQTHLAYFKYFRKHHGLLYALAVRCTTGIFSLARYLWHGARYALSSGRDEALRQSVKAYGELARWCFTGR